MQCPNCDAELKISDRQGVEIDYCPQCRGVWLDRGELDKILERTIMPPHAPRYYEEVERRFYHEDGNHTKLKRKNFLEELFDF
jgi:uncharacterized protein